MAISHGTPHPVTTGRCPEYDAVRRVIATAQEVDGLFGPTRPEHLDPTKGRFALSPSGRAWAAWFRRMRARERAGASCP